MSAINYSLKCMIEIYIFACLFSQYFEVTKVGSQIVTLTHGVLFYLLRQNILNSPFLKFPPKLCFWTLD